MMFSLQTLQNQGITIRETVYKSLDKLLLWNKESENSKYLELALLHMQAYANMGFALDEENKTICEILKKTGKTREDFFPKGYLLGKRIKPVSYTHLDVYKRQILKSIYSDVQK